MAPKSSPTAELCRKQLEMPKAGMLLSGALVMI